MKRNQPRTDGMIWLAALAVAAASCGSKDSKDSPAPISCEPARITLDGKPFAFTHGALASHKDDGWTVALFSSTNMFDGIRKPTDVTCAELLSSGNTADYVEVTAFDDAPTAAALAYDFHTLLAAGMTTDIGPIGKCTPGDPCNKISARVITRPGAPGATLEMCVSANVRFTDNDKLEHVLLIDGRIAGSYCGVRR